MTNREAHELRQGLEQVSQLPGAKFAYAVSKNKDKIDRDFKHLRKTLENEKIQEFQEKQNEIMSEFERKKSEVLEKHAKKNKNGDPLYNKSKDENGQMRTEYDIPEENMDPQGQIEKLKEEYKEAFEEFDKQKKEFQQLMEEESSVELHTISEDQLPDGITSEQMDAILPIVEPNE